MTKFSFEVPLKHLQDFDDLQDYFFTLSILYKKPEYTTYIRDKVCQGLKTIWLDNSFNETFQADGIDTLVQISWRYPFSRIICPDDISWSKEQISKAFIELANKIDVNRILVVVSNMEMYEYLKMQGAQHFAVSYWVRQKNFTLEELDNIPNVHFLGMLDIAELQLIKPISCDTSMPVKIACVGLDLDEWISSGCVHINTKDLGHHGKDFFDMTLDNWTLNLARRNICRLKELVNSRWKI